MLTTIHAGPYTIRGISVGGVYTSFHVPQLDSVLDIGIPPRSFAGARQLFLSHGHVDHVGGLASFLGIRALVGKNKPLKVYLPAAIAGILQEALASMARLQRYDLDIETVAMEPGQIEKLQQDLWVRAVRTFHPVPSLGYQFFRRIHKLRPEYSELPGTEIASLRKRGKTDELFEIIERLELAYATDTLVQVLDQEPTLYQSKVLILECTFLDERKSLAAARAGCHIHLDELLERASLFGNDKLVLMHFSQIYKSREVGEILRQRCPAELFQRIVPFASDEFDWPG